jgi:uncharacterized membrane protein (GlpM family)
MDWAFLLKLILSFVTGATVVVLVTIISERVGTRIGGVVTSMPSTSVIALVFIAWTEGSGAAHEATYAMPMGMAAVCAFILTYFLATKRFGRSFVAPIILSILIWFIIALPAMSSKLDLFISSLAFFLLYIPTYYLVSFSNKPNPQPKKPSAGSGEILLRAFFGGAVISLAVIMARFAGPLYGGTFGVFPAVFSSSFIILHSKHGPEFMQEFMRTIPFGAIGTFTFALSANQLYPVYGVALGTIFAYALAVLAVCILYFASFRSDKRI